MYYLITLYVFTFAYLISFIIYCVIHKSLIKLLFINSFAGLLTLMLLNLVEEYLGIIVKINYASVLLSSVLGVPGFGLYAFINNFFA